jgi:hypothetical protein
MATLKKINMARNGANGRVHVGTSPVIQKANLSPAISAGSGASRETNAIQRVVRDTNCW